MPVKLWQGWSSVQTRLTLAMLAAATIAVLALVLSRRSETRRTDAYMAAEAKEDGQLLDRTLELAGGSLATFAKDYSLWGEMVQFVQTGDRTWANVNIDVGIGTYQASAAWVFDTTGALVYEVRDSILETTPEPLPPGFAVKNMFGDSHFCYFFIAGPDGPVEIRGATIQPSEDDERKTPVRGYFLAARSWNREYLAGLTRLTGKTIAVGPARDGAKPTAEVARQSGEITFTRPLPGPQGKPELMLTALFRPEWIAMARRSSRNLSRRLAVLALLGILGLTLTLWLWVTRPLGRIRRSLETGTTEALKPLERNRTEFGQLAQLVDQSFVQNAALTKEVAERKQADAQIEQLSRFPAENPSPVLRISSDGTLVYANPSSKPMLDTLKRNLGARMPETWRERTQKALSSGKQDEFEEAYGSAAYSWLLTPIADQGYVNAYGRDITSGKQAEAALRESEARFRGIFDAARDGIALADVETGRLVTANGAFCSMLGYTPEEIVRLSVPDFYPSDSLAYVKESFEMQAAGKASHSADIPMKRKDGSVFYADINSTAMSLGGRNLLIGVFRDVTERKHAEEALRTSEAQLSNAMEIAKLSYWEYDVADDLFTFNDHFYALFGTTAEKVGGYKMASAEYARRFVHPDDAAMVGIETRKAIETTDPHLSRQLEHRIIYADGSVGYISVRFFVVKDAQGRTVKTFGANQDITEQKLAEAKLRESELEFRAIFDNASDGMFLVEQESRRFVLANSSCLRMLGYSADEFANLRITDLHPDEDLHFVFEQIGSFVKGESGRRGDVRFKRKDGSLFPADTRPAGMMLGDENCILIVFNDITERKQAEDALAQMSRQNQLILDAAGEGIIGLDAEDRCTFANPTAIQMLGYDLNGLNGQRIHALTHHTKANGEPYPLEECPIHRAYTEGQAHRAADELFWRKDGAPFPVEYTATPVRDGERLTGAVVTFKDVSERRRTEEDVKLKAELLDSGTDSIFLHDLAGRCLYANENSYKTRGYTKEEFLALALDDLDVPEYAARLEPRIADLRRTGEATFESAHFRRDGSAMPVEIHARILEVAGRKLILSVARDITERKQAEAELVKYRNHLEELVHARTGELEQANKELETFSYSVSHDLRAPLRAINGFAQALQEDCAAQLDTTGHDYLDRVRAASRSMGELIDNLLTLARSSRLPLERKPVDLTGLTRMIAGELHSAEPTRQVELVIPDGMTAQADPVLAEMVLRNLLNNAWKFTGKHPTARIEVGETVRDGEPVWFIRDDGAGFDMAYVGNLSKPFQRLHGPADFPGTGIGLVTVQRLVRRHGGRGWIEGAVEKGATFYFTFQTATREA